MRMPNNSTHAIDTYKQIPSTTPINQVVASAEGLMLASLNIHSIFLEGCGV